MKVILNYKNIRQFRIYLLKELINFIEKLGLINKFIFRSTNKKIKKIIKDLDQIEKFSINFLRFLIIVSVCVVFRIKNHETAFELFQN